MPGKYVIKPAMNGGWDISLRNGNGEIYLTTVTCRTNTGARNSIEPVETNFSQEGRYELEISPSGKFFLVLKAGSIEVIGVARRMNPKLDGTTGWLPPAWAYFRVKSRDN